MVNMWEKCGWQTLTTIFRQLSDTLMGPLSGTYHLYDKPQAFACTVFHFLPSVFMKWDTQASWMKYVSFSATGVSLFCLAYFIPCLWLFHRIFHYLPGAICYPFHSLPWAISWDFSLPARCNLWSISFLALDYFIPSSLHFSLLSRCDFLSFHSLPWGIS